MRKIIAATVTTGIVLFFSVVPCKRISADDFGPDQGQFSNFPPAPFDPLLYEPASFPQASALKLISRGDASGDSGASRLLSPAVFNSLSSAGQRGALLLNGIAPERRGTNSRLFTQTALAPNLDPQENVQVTREDNNVHGPGRHTHSENSAAVVGDNVIVSYNDNGGQVPFSGYGFSSDGGKTFTQNSLPPGPSGDDMGDGVVAVGPKGEVYYATLFFDGNSSAVGVAKSLTGGRASPVRSMQVPA